MVLSWRLLIDEDEDLGRAIAQDRRHVQHLHLVTSRDIIIFTSSNASIHTIDVRLQLPMCPSTRRHSISTCFMQKANVNEHLTKSILMVGN